MIIFFITTWHDCKYIWLNLIPSCLILGFSTFYYIAWHTIFSLASWQSPFMTYDQHRKTLLTLGCILLMWHKTAGFQMWYWSRNVFFLDSTKQYNKKSHMVWAVILFISSHLHHGGRRLCFFCLQTLFTGKLMSCLRYYYFGFLLANTIIVTLNFVTQIRSSMIGL